MKNIINFFIVFCLILVSQQSSISQELFQNSNINTQTHNAMLRSFPDIDIELIKKNILFLNLNSSIMEEVLHNNQSKIDLEIPFFNKSKLDLQQID